MYIILMSEIAMLMLKSTANFSELQTTCILQLREIHVYIKGQKWCTDNGKLILVIIPACRENKGKITPPPPPDTHTQKKKKKKEKKRKKRKEQKIFQSLDMFFYVTKILYFNITLVTKKEEEEKRKKKKKKSIFPLLIKCLYHYQYHT